jgi:hypothetical protein
LFDVSLERVSEPRQGLTPARRRGVVSTRCDWIAFVDDDCLLAEDGIDRAAVFAAAHTDCGAFSGKVILDVPGPFDLDPRPEGARLMRAPAPVTRKTPMSSGFLSPDASPASRSV